MSLPRSGKARAQERLIDLKVKLKAENKAKEKSQNGNIRDVKADARPKFATNSPVDRKVIYSSRSTQRATLSPQADKPSRENIQDDQYFQVFGRSSKHKAKVTEPSPGQYYQVLGKAAKPTNEKSANDNQYVKVFGRSSESPLPGRHQDRGLSSKSQLVKRKSDNLSLNAPHDETSASKRIKTTELLNSHRAANDERRHRSPIRKSRKDVERRVDKPVCSTPYQTPSPTTGIDTDRWVSSGKRKSDSLTSPNVIRNLYKRKPCDSSTETILGSLPSLNNSEESNVAQETLSEKFKSAIAGKCKSFQDKIVDTLKSFFPGNNTKTEPIEVPTSNVTDLNSHIQKVRCLIDPKETEKMDYEITNPLDFRALVTELMFVVDTNVLISSLNLIKDMMKNKVKGMAIKLVIPWQVLKELDYIKNDRNSFNKMNSVSRNARVATNYLLDSMCEPSSSEYILGQPQSFALEELNGFSIEVPDDHLIKCCLQLKEKGHNVMLLTNDKNLSVKANVSSIMTITDINLMGIMHAESEKELSPFEKPVLKSNVPHVTTISKVTTHLSEFLTMVLRKYLPNKHGNMWLWFSPGPAPWSIKSCLEHCLKYLEELVPSTNKNIESVLEELIKFYSQRIDCSSVTIDDVEFLGRNCHKLARASTTNYKDEAITLEKNIAFLKNTKFLGPIPSKTYEDECCSLTMKLVSLVETGVTALCVKISQDYGLPFKPVVSPPSIPDYYSMNDINYCWDSSSKLLRYLTEISSVPVGSVEVTSPGVEELHTLLLPLHTEKTVIFSPEDVVEFGNNILIRNSLVHGLDFLQEMTEFLTISREAILANMNR